MVCEGILGYEPRFLVLLHKIEIMGTPARAALFSAMCKDGGLPTIRHDTVKWTIEEVFSALLSRVTVEVVREFTRFLPAAGTGDLGSQRVVPDLKIWATPAILADVKGITLSKSRYLDYTLQSNEYESGFAVKKLAVDTDVRRHLKKLDVKHNATALDSAAPGPLLRHLNTYGKVKGFVVSCFGEISTDLDQSVCATAKLAVKTRLSTREAIWQAPSASEAYARTPALQLNSSCSRQPR